MKCLILDRDNTIIHNSSAPESPFYYILHPSHLVLKPRVKEAMALLSILRAKLGFKVVLATRQTCISKGLISRAQVDQINAHLEYILGFTFDQIYVEESEPTKANLFPIILRHAAIAASDAYLIDDSWQERNTAWNIGVGPRPSHCYDTDLYSTVCSLFKINP